MDENLTMLGGSLKVPWVQELAKEPLDTLPPRYVRTDEHNITTNIGLISDNQPQVPVINLQTLLLCGDDDLLAINSELHKLHYACQHWGFFQVINHGMSSSLMEKVKSVIDEMFNLPMEEKKKLWQQPGDLEGFGQGFVVSEEQKLDWADMFYLVTLPDYLRKPWLFSSLPLPYRETIEAFSAELKRLAMQLLGVMAKALKMKEEEMKDLFDEGMLSLRMNHYPPCPQPELALGFSPHSDGDGLTILLQINQTDGLQIKKDGMWIPVKPLPDAFIVNIGDMLEIITNGIYRSIEHRATVNKDKERLSVAAFFSPKLDGDMGPVPSLITPETPALFKRIGVADFFKGLFSRELDGKSYIDTMRIETE